MSKPMIMKSALEIDNLQERIDRSLDAANDEDHILMYRLAQFNLAWAAERVRDIMLDLGTSKLVTVCTDKYYGKSCRIGEASERRTKEQQLQQSTDRTHE